MTEAATVLQELQVYFVTFGVLRAFFHYVSQICDFMCLYGELSLVFTVRVMV